MLYNTMVCRQQKQKKKRFQIRQERRFVVPVSEKQIWTVTGVFRKDICSCGNRLPVKRYRFPDRGSGILV